MFYTLDPPGSSFRPVPFKYKVTIFFAVFFVNCLFSPTAGAIGGNILQDIKDIKEKELGIYGILGGVVIGLLASFFMACKPLFVIEKPVNILKISLLPFLLNVASIISGYAILKFNHNKHADMPWDKVTYAALLGSGIATMIFFAIAYKWIKGIIGSGREAFYFPTLQSCRKKPPDLNAMFHPPGQPGTGAPATGATDAGYFRAPGS